MYARTRCLAGLAGLLFLLSACGGGTAATVTPFDIAPVPPPASGGSGGGGTTPPPTPPQAPVWNPNAHSHARILTFGSFPSDLVRHGNTLFANDADEIDTGGAQITPLDISSGTPVASTSFAPTTIRAADLRDSAGARPALPATIGFGLFLNDFEVVSDDLGFALANAGGSDSSPTLSNVVVFDPQTGAIRQTVNLANVYVGMGALFDSNGNPVPNDTFVQSGAESLAYVPTGANTGLLYVAMSNLIFGAPSFGTHRFPGTLQVYDVNTARIDVVREMPEMGHTTRTLRTSAYNPVSIDLFQTHGSVGGAPMPRLLVTCGGTTGFDMNFNLVPLTNAVVEAYDGTTSSLLGTFALGLVGLGGSPALGRDTLGHELGYFPSAVTGEVYVLQLDGLYDAVVDPARLSVLRGPGNGIPIAGPQGSPGGNITGIGLSPDGRTLVVAGFGDLFAVPRKPGKVFVAALPDDVVSGSGFGVSFVPGTSEFASVAGRTVGSLVLVANTQDQPDVYVNVGGSLDNSGLGSGPATLGSLNTRGLIR